MRRRREGIDDPAGSALCPVFLHFALQCFAAEGRVLAPQIVGHPDVMKIILHIDRPPGIENPQLQAVFPQRIVGIAEPFADGAPDQQVRDAARSLGNRAGSCRGRNGSCRGHRKRTVRPAARGFRGRRVAQGIVDSCLLFQYRLVGGMGLSRREPSSPNIIPSPAQDEPRLARPRSPGKPASTMARRERGGRHSSFT